LRPGDETVLDRVAPGVFDDPIDADGTRRFLADERHHIAVALEGALVVGFASGVHYFHPDKPSARSTAGAPTSTRSMRTTACSGWPGSIAPSGSSDCGARTSRP
jgi:hypothetical protein